MKHSVIIYSILLITFTCSCWDNSKITKSLSKKTKKSMSAASRSRSQKTDTLLINTRSAISVWLDTATLNKRRKQYGGEAFETGADDDVNYSYIADSVLKAKGLPIIDAVNYKYLKFVQKNGSTTLIKIDTLAQIYNLFFFDSSKAPYNPDVTMIKDEYNKFYHH